MNGQEPKLPPARSSSVVVHYHIRWIIVAIFANLWFPAADLWAALNLGFLLRSEP
ncbi:uncharacterized protein BDW70DRAFT_135289 [Aspergillus foveolatus]|uniref:uncharacterized protein n=1 Tax=Aspergillus foveolatus TaxID=210207 RepID=UPI003CCD2B28